MHRFKKSELLLAGTIVWIFLSRVLQGHSTLELPTSDNTPVTTAFGDAAASIRGNRTKSAAFIYFFNPIRAIINGFVEAIRTVISVPRGNSVIPLIGWFGVVAIVAFTVYATSRLRTALLATSLLLACGALGMWQFTMDTFAMTFASVLLSLALGVPLGIWAGLSDRVLKISGE